MKIYFDNAAGTPVSHNVLQTVWPLLQNPIYGNEEEQIVLTGKTEIARLLQADAETIHFTDGGTTHLLTAIENSGVSHLITDGQEDDAFLTGFKRLQKQTNIRRSTLSFADGQLDLGELAFLLRVNPESFISINTVHFTDGTLYDLEKISLLAKQYKARLHINLTHIILWNRPTIGLADHITINGNGINAFAGTGLFYTKPGIYTGLLPFPVTGFTVKSLSEALQYAFDNRDENRRHTAELKDHLLHELSEYIPEIEVISQPNNSHEGWLVVRFPKLFSDQGLYEYLRENNIAVSGTSSTASETLRFSFSQRNTHDEVSYVAEILASLYERVQ